jgi:hypothetical protein
MCFKFRKGNRKKRKKENTKPTLIGSGPSSKVGRLLSFPKSRPAPSTQPLPPPATPLLSLLSLTHSLSSSLSFLALPRAVPQPCSFSTLSRRAAQPLPRPRTPPRPQLRAATEPDARALHFYRAPGPAAAPNRSPTPRTPRPSHPPTTVRLRR